MFLCALVPRLALRCVLSHSVRRGDEFCALKIIFAVTGNSVRLFQAVERAGESREQLFASKPRLAQAVQACHFFPLRAFPRYRLFPLRIFPFAGFSALQAFSYYGVFPLRFFPRYRLFP